MLLCERLFDDSNWTRLLLVTNQIYLKTGGVHMQQLAAGVVFRVETYGMCIK